MIELSHGKLAITEERASKMGQNHVKRKIKGALFVGIWVFLAISCSNLGSQNYIGNKGEASQSQESPSSLKAEDSFEASNFYSQEQMQELYCFLEGAIRTKYLEPNGISKESFRWPEYEVLPNGIIRDEDHAWSYFNNIALNYSKSGTLYDAKGFMYDLPEKEVRELMDVVLEGVVDWVEAHKEKGDSFQKVREAIFPEYEKLPQNIDFSG